MKRLLSLILCTLIMIGMLSACADVDVISNSNDSTERITAVSNVSQANTQFAFDIFKELNDEDKKSNIFISPFSISTALAMTYQGAGGTTGEAMAKALRFSAVNTKELNDSYKNILKHLSKTDKNIELNIGNSIWVREGQRIKEEFIKENKNVFDAKVSTLDFSKKESAEKINSWISEATKGKIQKMISPPIPQEVIMYLINAVYFKGEWTNRFESKNTSDGKFLSEDGTEQTAKMMKRTGEVEFGQGDGYKAVRLPYGKGKVAMYCVLPDEGVSINDFIKRIDLAEWEKIKKSISEKDDVILQIPRFKMEYGIKELKDSLTALGMGEAFSDRADFSGIREGVSISRVLHKAVIEVNEEGSEAAGVTVVEVKETAALLEPISFIANRPFVFAIADDETDTILFMGKLSDLRE